MLLPKDRKKKKKESIYKRVLSEAFYNFSNEYDVPYFSDFFCELSDKKGRKDIVNVYINFPDKEQESKYLLFFKNEFVEELKRNFIKKDTFSFLPDFRIFSQKKTDVNKEEELRRIIEKLKKFN